MTATAVLAPDVCPRAIAEVAVGRRPPPRTVAPRTFRLLAALHGLVPPGRILRVRTVVTHQLPSGVGHAVTIWALLDTGAIVALLADVDRTGRLLRIDPLRPGGTFRR